MKEGTCAFVQNLNEASGNPTKSYPDQEKKLDSKRLLFFPVLHLFSSKMGNPLISVLTQLTLQQGASAQEQAEVQPCSC